MLGRTPEMWIYVELDKGYCTLKRFRQKLESYDVPNYNVAVMSARTLYSSRDKYSVLAEYAMMLEMPKTMTIMLQFAMRE